MTPGNAGGLVGKTLGEYQLIALLGAGGMAEVYRAQDLSLGREVAVKVLPASLAADAGYVERFRDEARRVAALNHPNVVPVYHYGEEQGLLFLVMPILKESLRERMGREGIPAPADAARLVVQIAAALDAAHAAGIVHRDVKPENILLDEQGKAHLTDFGIARELDFLKQTGTNRTLAASGLPVGTPEYMAPEQLRAELVDQRADVYGLGAVLYELLTGTVPHDGPSPYEVAALVLTAPVLPPSERNPDIWPALDDVVMMALAKDADERFPGTRAFAMALRRAVLERDSSVQRLTMPAQTLTGMPAVAPYGGKAPNSGRLVPPKPNSGRLVPPSSDAGAPPQWPAQERPESWRAKFEPRPSGGRKGLIIAMVVALVLIGVCGGSGFALLSGFGAALTGGNNTLTGDSSAISTDTAATYATATVITQQTVSAGGVPPTALPTARPGQTVVPDATPTDTPQPDATATNTPQPSATATNAPQPTATLDPTRLALSPSSGFISLTANNGTCTSAVPGLSIYNPTGGTAWWTWNSVPPKSGFQYKLNTSTWTNGTPHDWNFQQQATDNLSVKFSCQRGQTYTVTMSDSLGNTYSLSMQAN